MSPSSFDAAAVAAGWGHALRLEGELPLAPGFHLRRRRAAIERLYDLLVLDSGTSVAALNPSVHAAFEASLACTAPSLEAFRAWRASSISDRHESDSLLYVDRRRFKPADPLPGTELRILDEADEGLFDGFAAAFSEEEFEASRLDPSAELVAGLFTAGRLVAAASAGPAAEAEAEADADAAPAADDPRWPLAHLALPGATLAAYSTALLSFLADRALAQGGYPELRVAAASGASSPFSRLEAERLGFFGWAGWEYPEGED
ncbi:MAG: hypothetical protein JNG85_17580 [Spirochaetaceae bacterium]|nr:hypothetical protein [Spirochaetaceae bacterium]